MMKRRASFQQKSRPKWRTRIFVVLLLSLFVGIFVFVHAKCSRISLRLSVPNPFVRSPKIAFLFIARNRLPLDFVWDAFFGAEKENKFSIYVHSRPGFVFNTVTTKSVYFLNRQVNNSIEVVWGEASMIQAERILLENALTDPSNERFVFLSDSCIPLYNFSYTYEYIMSTSTSFVDSFADTKDERYNPKMHPIVPIQHWRKGSQWVVLTRKHAEVVVKDEKVFPVFQQHCKRKSLPEFWRHQHLPVNSAKEHNCIPDEHYVQTLLAQEHLEGEITRRSLTHSAWDLSASKDPKRQGWHPVAYKFSDATPQLIQSIKDIDNIYYETEYRREWCSSKGRPSTCFLFARKFTRPAALRLLNMVTSPRHTISGYKDHLKMVSLETRESFFSFSPFILDMIFSCHFAVRDRNFLLSCLYAKSVMSVVSTIEDTKTLHVG